MEHVLKRHDIVVTQFPATPAMLGAAPQSLVQSYHLPKPHRAARGLDVTWYDVVVVIYCTYFQRFDMF